MNNCENYRFIERYRPFRDLTFKFYSNGSLTIIDNTAEEVITPRELKGESYDFYVKRRIAYIKQNLHDKLNKYA
ncbi:hypothetical protein Back11_12720 [Paenibacillus baekrokdamisoli]|uniref:Uncharacterized protein n=1 Tax=Paenibacillus baekrokdamisoli TaxID=1712516 RepID=A0A3G9ILV1_9BACL|nr:hypothetical protein [Paenibacillus baekrokdamisoli]MBB3070577.1 hypothetical protein [Paenibacillus baekrokdamisoli]BBH19927.1 hypothetical protein Back11_12720 [Paenibacillus baekrokdamisoli]